MIDILGHFNWFKKLNLGRIVKISLLIQLWRMLLMDHMIIIQKTPRHHNLPLVMVEFSSLIVEEEILVVTIMVMGLLVNYASNMVMRPFNARYNLMKHLFNHLNLLLQTRLHSSHVKYTQNFTPSLLGSAQQLRAYVATQLSHTYST